MIICCIFSPLWISRWVLNWPTRPNDMLYCVHLCDISLLRTSKGFLLHCTMRRSFNEISRLEIPPFSWGRIISDRIFGGCLLFSFTFDIYLGTSRTQPTAEEGFTIESVEPGCRKNVTKFRDELNTVILTTPQIFGEEHLRRQIFSYFKLRFHNEGLDC